MAAIQVRPNIRVSATNDFLPITFGVLPHLPTVVGEASSARTSCPRTVRVHRLLNPVPVGIILVVGPHLQGAAVDGALFGPGHLVAVVVSKRPGFQAGALALLGQIALVVVRVGVDPVVGQPVPRAGLVAAHRPVAVGVVAVGGRAVVGQLVRRVVGVGLDRAIGGLGLQPVAHVVGVRVVGDQRAPAVAVLQVFQAGGVVVGVRGRANLGAT